MSEVPLYQIQTNYRYPCTHYRGCSFAAWRRVWGLRFEIWGFTSHARWTKCMSFRRSFDPAESRENLDATGEISLSKTHTVFQNIR